MKVIASRGVVTEDRIWERSRLWSVVPSWPCVGVPVRGHGVMRSGDRSLEMGRGWLGFVRNGADFRARTEPADAFGVFVQWDPAVYGKPPELEIAREAVDARDLERFAAAAMAIQSTDSPRSVVAANVAELLRLFGARGFFGAHLPDQPLVTPAPLLRIERVGMAIDTILSRAGTRPMVVDLSHALGCSDRQARYLVREYADAYALQGAREWRTLVSVWTTYLAGLLMTARDATTERVASLLGYSSPNAFCHALGNAGLPSPGEVRRHVAQLG